MSPPAESETDALASAEQRRRVRAALSRAAYGTDQVRLTGHSMVGCDWLVATPRGLFAVAPTMVVQMAHGWFFGICRDGRQLYLFENCGHRDRAAHLGRIIRLTIDGDRLTDPAILVRGLHGNAHQLRKLDGTLHLVDTANQQILRFACDGAPLGAISPLPPATVGDSSGAYCHINSIANVAGRYALMLHNGHVVPTKASEVAWYDADWRLERRVPIPGHKCHDIAVGPDGRLWHSLSEEGAICASDGERHQLSDELMTRGIAFGPAGAAFGLSSFGPRQMRDALGGCVEMRRADMAKVGQVTLPGPPADIVAIAD